MYIWVALKNKKRLLSRLEVESRALNRGGAYKIPWRITIYASNCCEATRVASPKGTGTLFFSL